MKDTWIPILVGIIVIPLFTFAMIYMVNSGEEYSLKNVTYVDTDPAPNTVSSVFGVFENSNGERVKLYMNEDRIKQLTEGNKYDVTYRMKTKSYPYDNIVSSIIPVGSEKVSEN